MCIQQVSDLSTKYLLYLIQLDDATYFVAHQIGPTKKCAVAAVLTLYSSNRMEVQQAN